MAATDDKVFNVGTNEFKGSKNQTACEKQLKKKIVYSSITCQNIHTVFPPIGAWALIKNFGQRGVGDLLEGEHLIKEGVY